MSGENHQTVWEPIADVHFREESVAHVIDKYLLDC